MYAQIVGALVGYLVGAGVSKFSGVGPPVGPPVGVPVGLRLGAGDFVGEPVGEELGVTVGGSVFSIQRFLSAVLKSSVVNTWYGRIPFCLLGLESIKKRADPSWTSLPAPTPIAKLYTPHSFSLLSSLS